jgi:hypothetical protein
VGYALNHQLFPCGGSCPPCKWRTSSIPAAGS